MTELFFVLLVVGIILLGAEIFVPGGVLGLVGGLSLLGAVVTGFLAFPGLGGLIAVGIVALVGVALIAWIRYFPGSAIGRRMTVAENLSLSKGTQEGLRDLLGKEGVAASSLHPSGFATIDGRRVDVVTRGEMIARGEPVRVVHVESNRVVVIAAAPPPGGSAAAQG
jgi:membrane-bound serine protease (ClpP class)